MLQLITATSDRSRKDLGLGAVGVVRACPHLDHFEKACYSPESSGIVTSVPCFCTFYRSIPTWKFCRDFSTSFCCFLGGVVNQIPCSARFEIVSATHLKMLYQQPSTIYMYIYAMAFSAVLNSLQIDGLNREATVDVLGRHSLLPANSSHVCSPPSTLSHCRYSKTICMQCVTCWIKWSLSRPSM